MGALARVAECDEATTIFYAQPFWRDRQGFSAAGALPFEDRAKAIDAGKDLAARFAGVIVFSVTGVPSAEFWDEPVPLWSSGQIPDFDF